MATRTPPTVSPSCTCAMQPEPTAAGLSREKISSTRAPKAISMARSVAASEWAGTVSCSELSVRQSDGGSTRRLARARAESPPPAAGRTDPAAGRRAAAAAAVAASPRPGRARARAGAAHRAATAAQRRSARPWMSTPPLLPGAVHRAEAASTAQRGWRRRQSSRVERLRRAPLATARALLRRAEHGA
eukprot:1817816-Prymnesium_polylepis.1